MTINDWSQEQLRSFVQTLIDRKPFPKELPQAPVAQVGDSLRYTGTEWKPVPRELTYNQITSNVTITGTVEAFATTIVTASTLTFDGATTVMIEFYASQVRPSSNATDFVKLVLFDGNTALGELATVVTPAANILGVPVYAKYRLTPSSGLHSYIIKGFRGTANGTVFANTLAPGQDAPCFVRITTV